MSLNREERIRFLLRKAAHARDLAPFKEKIQRLTTLSEAQLNFLPLEESDRLIADFHRHYRELSDEQKLMVTWEEPEPLKQVLSELSAIAGSSELYIHFPDGDVLGALPMNSSLFFPNAFQLLTAAGDCIHAVSHTDLSGVTLDFYEEGRTGITYEIIGWGIYQELVERSIAKICPQKLARWRIGSSSN